MVFMRIALIEARKGFLKKHGGPFGAVITCNNKIVSKAHNTVLRDNDPTAHAEINAIRLASKKLKRFDLSDCELYSTCEPCPMCFSAIHWANIKKVFFGASSKDASKIGFKDKQIYEILSGKKKSNIILKKVECDDCVLLMQEFDNWVEKKLY